VSSAFYDIMFILGGITIYTVIVGLGFRQSVKEFKKAYSLVLTLKEVIEEIKTIVTKEENGMSEKEIKITGEKIAGQGYICDSSKFVLESDEPKNSLTLSDLLTRKATNEEYREVVSLLSKLARDTYKEYKFLIAKSTDETQQPNFLQIISNSKEKPEQHKEIFAKGLEYGIDMRELQKRFAAHVANNLVIDLGDEVTVITDDGTGQAPTGVSPINNGLEGGEICFIISFLKTENFDEWHKNNFPEESANE
jgi:hypothetical protein